MRWPCTFHFLCVDFFALGSKRKPHFQWNIGCLGSLALGLCVGHVHFIFFVLISFASGTQRKPVFWWNMGFKSLHYPATNQYKWVVDFINFRRLVEEALYSGNVSLRGVKTVLPGGGASCFYLSTGILTPELFPDPSSCHLTRPCNTYIASSLQ